MPYIPTDWSRGEVITEAKLDKLEQGVAGAVQAADLGTELSTQGTPGAVALSAALVDYETKAGASAKDAAVQAGIPAAAAAAVAPGTGTAFGISGGTVFIPPGRTIASVPLNVQNFVSWGGAGRDLSWVHIIADRSGNASTAGTSDWLTCAGRTSATVWENGRIQDNDIYDLAATVTQLALILITGATLTNVRRAGNTGDA